MELDQLREHAVDLGRRSDWAGVLGLAEQLRQDSDYWHGFFAPLLAVAARHLDDPAARSYLDEATAGGFYQPEIFDGEIEQLFGADEDWTAVAAAIRANVPPPTVELTAWPELPLAAPVRLQTITAERQGALRDRLPEPGGSAWDTALGLLGWVSSRWEHSGASHVDDGDDALVVLDRVAAGERFACKEYTIVLSQALNACGIPARSVLLMRQGYHGGLGGAHAVSEAWIDDLGRWILLDGQNGMYWSNGQPLGLTELRGRYHAGQVAPDVVSLAGKKSATPETWWPYFHTTGVTGLMAAAAPFAPMLDRISVVIADELRVDSTGSHPDLSGLGIGIAGVDGTPAILPLTRHPYARRFEVRHGGDTHAVPIGGAWPLPDREPGEHTATLATHTPFGAHGAHALRWVTRPA